MTRPTTAAPPTAIETTRPTPRRFAGRLRGAMLLSLLATNTVASPAAADVFAMPEGLVSLAFVEVGSPGNPPDTNGRGAVAYRFRIARHEVTAAQWVDFLEHAGRAEPDGGLWNNDMDTERSGEGPRCEIRRAGDPGAFRYTVARDRADRPVTHVSVLDACRVCNWLHNGQGDGDTETGAYTLAG